ncbi:urea ABC transporter ATP-binding protein UrtD [Pseudodesulfovibrio sp.]|uniref:urea ABC transporter ATP-binding protein UrtD n=1 Tax=unclassified Pseudodesulfovibrio TaxID=2661612 RepID=UPI003B00AB00
MAYEHTHSHMDKAEPINTSHGILLYVNGVTVSFDGFKALNNLSLSVDNGALHCIIGPNGAGKTTMLDIITGKTRPDEGTVFFGTNLELTKLNEFEVARAGVGRKFQTPTVFEQLTLFENLELALKADKGLVSSLFWKLSGEQRDRIEEVLETIGAKDHGNMQAGLLSHGQKQWLEIGMLLMQAPRLLLLDEPAAGMTPQELENSIELLNSLKGDHTVVVIEHDMEFVRAIAERVTVLHEGSVLAEGSMDFVQSNPKVVEVYLGE